MELVLVHSSSTCLQSTMAGCPPALPSPPHDTLCAAVASLQPVPARLAPGWAARCREPISNAWPLCLARDTICFCHWSLAALLEILKPSRSDQELPRVCCFSCDVGCVCQWPTSSEHLTSIVPKLLLQFTWAFEQCKPSERYKQMNVVWSFQQHCNF